MSANRSPAVNPPTAAYIVGVGINQYVVVALASPPAVDHGQRGLVVATHHLTHREARITGLCCPVPRRAAVGAVVLAQGQRSYVVRVPAGCTVQSRIGTQYSKSQGCAGAR